MEWNLVDRSPRSRPGSRVAEKQGLRESAGTFERDLSDYQVSILEVAGTAATVDEILGMEIRWKEKLQSRQMGLNRN